MNLKPHILEWLERGDDTALTPERAARAADIETIRAFEEHLAATSAAQALDNVTPAMRLWAAELVRR